VAPLVAQAQPLPGDSLYQLDIALQGADGAAFRLAELRGRPLLVTMFYSHCAAVCPMLTAQVQRLVGSLPAAERGPLRVLMVSLDSAGDSPQALREFRAEHHIGDANWITARAEAADVRTLAAALGIQYRELPDHTFNHSTVISVADPEGTVRARTSELNGPDPAFVAAVRVQVATRPLRP
jgi:protein SCO1/2